MNQQCWVKSTYAGKNNPTCVLSYIYPVLGLSLTQCFLECVVL